MLIDAHRLINTIQAYQAFIAKGYSSWFFNPTTLSAEITSFNLSDVDGASLGSAIYMAGLAYFIGGGKW